MKKLIILLFVFLFACKTDKTSFAPNYQIGYENDKTRILIFPKNELYKNKDFYKILIFHLADSLKNQKLVIQVNSSEFYPIKNEKFILDSILLQNLTYEVLDSLPNQIIYSKMF